MSEQSNFYIWDLETFPNIFVFNGKFKGSSEVQTFEMSTRKDQRSELLTWLSYLQNSKVEMVGFNSLGFDYIIIHQLLNNVYTFTYKTAFQLCQQIINQGEYGLSAVPLRERIIPQIDLVKINHFDNKAKRTPLKSLQFAMRSQSVQDLPFVPETELTSEQMDILIEYGVHDVTETEAFLDKCLHLIALRKELLQNGVLTGDVLNFSDVKLGTEYLVKRIGRTKCYSGNKPIQTFRHRIEIKDIILPNIFFRTESFGEVLEWFKKQDFYPQGQVQNPEFEKQLAGIHFKFGVGGAHASVENKVYRTNETHMIKDIDVTSMYPSIAIANGFAPEHLGKDFSTAYAQLVTDRKQYPKGSTMNAVLKLASNGAFGNSDNVYSPFYDPRFPKQITINGQLQILQLVELMSLIPRLEIIQANTDGVTVYMPREMEMFFNLWKDDWQQMTGLKLEEVEYSKMWISDVNNYLTVTVDGKVKRKGKYWYPTDDREYDSQWNKNFSSMVVQKAAEQMLLNGWKPEDLVKCITDPFDFMIRYKTPSGAKVFIGDTECSKTVRYYVSTKGQPMKKIAQPKGEHGSFKRKNSLSDAYFEKIMKEIGPGVWDERIHTSNKKKYEMVTTSIESGRLVKECNVASKFDWTDVDYDYYIQEIKKLYIGEKNV